MATFSLNESIDQFTPAILQLITASPMTLEGKKQVRALGFNPRKQGAEPEKREVLSGCLRAIKSFFVILQYLLQK